MLPKLRNKSLGPQAKYQDAARPAAGSNGNYEMLKNSCFRLFVFFLLSGCALVSCDSEEMIPVLHGPDSSTYTHPIGEITVELIGLQVRTLSDKLGIRIGVFDLEDMPADQSTIVVRETVVYMNGRYYALPESTNRVAIRRDSVSVNVRAIEGSPNVPAVEMILAALNRENGSIDGRWMLIDCDEQVDRIPSECVYGGESGDILYCTWRWDANVVEVREGKVYWNGDCYGEINNFSIIIICRDKLFINESRRSIVPAHK